jgi:glucosyl-3-phosphoglycerate synthase
MRFAMSSRWLEKNTFHHSDFKDIDRLVAAKKRKKVRISLCFPTLNEEETIGKQILIMKSELVTRYPLLDEILVIDSDSEDQTRDIARTYGADVYRAAEILPDLKPFKGKGENLWKALYIAKGDIIVYIDADIKNIHHRFVYALLGPLLCFDHIKYAKAFYDRPLVGRNIMRFTGGGRVTELVIRPLFSLFFPELTQIIQPLSGEYAGYRDIFEKIPFPIGYGVETSLILDICHKWGMDVVAQVDLDRRVHRHHDTKVLGKMAFVILKTFCDRIERLGIVKMKSGLYDEMIQYNLVRNQYCADITRIEGHERPPMVENSDYRAKFNLDPR